MARIRTIKPEFWQDELIGELSTNARLLFIASWNLSDDEGLLRWNAAFLRAQVFMYDDLTISDVQGLMDELVGLKLIHSYKDAKQQKYGWIINFRKHQKIDRPQKAKHPLPSLQNREVKEVYLARDGGCCSICGEEIENPEMSGDKAKSLSLDHVKPQAKGGGDEPSNIKCAHFGCNSSKKDKFDECSTNHHEQLTSGKEQGTGKGTGNREGSIPASQAKPRARKTPIPANFGISERVRSWADEKGYSQLEVHLEAFRNKAYAKGYKYADWDSAFMEAIRANWAGVSSGPNSQAKPSSRQASLEAHNQQVADNWQPPGA